MQTPPKPKAQPIPEMVGATSAPVLVDKAKTTVSFAIHPPSGPALRHAPVGPGMIRADGSPVRILLRVENITSKEPSSDLDVYVNLGADADPAKNPELHAGRLPMFGLVEASTAGVERSDNGLFHVLDITKLYDRLSRQDGWDSKTIRITIVPMDPEGISVRIGRVSLYIA